MRALLLIAIFIVALTGCGSASESPAANSSVPGSAARAQQTPTVAPRAAASSPTRESPPPAPPGVSGVAHTAPPPASAAPAVAPGVSAAPPAPTAVPEAAPAVIPLPPGPVHDWPAGDERVTWNGISFRYDPRLFAFTELAPDAPQEEAAAELVERPTACTDPASGADCHGTAIFLEVYPRAGADVHTWVARQFPTSPCGTDGTDTIVGDHHALLCDGVADIGLSLAYMVPVGEKILVIRGGGVIMSFVSQLEVAEPAPQALEIGQMVMTTPDQAWDLWTAPAGGERNAERPQLYGGSLVLLLAREPQAARVRTTEGVEGWIQAPPATALLAPAAAAGAQAELLRERWQSASVISPNGIPLRVAPNSAAAAAVEQMPAAAQVQVIGVRGDWLRVYVPYEAGRDWPLTGWVRWQYDGQRYVEIR